MVGNLLRSFSLLLSLWVSNSHTSLFPRISTHESIWNNRAVFVPLHHKMSIIHMLKDADITGNWNGFRGKLACCLLSIKWNERMDGGWNIQKKGGLAVQSFFSAGIFSLVDLELSLDDLLFYSWFKIEMVGDIIEGIPKQWLALSSSNVKLICVLCSVDSALGRGSILILPSSVVVYVWAPRQIMACFTHRKVCEKAHALWVEHEKRRK